ncbi:MAG: signal peptidase I [Acidobacteriota bacterium]|nr:signal peptidase I [Acidobacteriota bacterium]
MSIAVQSGGDAARVSSEQRPVPAADVSSPESEQSAVFGAPSALEAPVVEAAPEAIVAHRHGLLQSFQSLVNLVVIALFIITFTVQPFRIPSASMEPTLLVGDFLLVNKQVGFETSPRIFPPTGEMHRGDVVVFHYPVDASLHLVKRVIGLPGDHLRLRDGRVYINGSAIAEPYAVFRPSMPDTYRDDFPRLVSADPGVDSRWWIEMRRLVSQGELTVPPDNYFVLGDNRNDSEDSRYWGFVPRAAIVGKPMLVYFSLNDGGATPGQANAAALASHAAQHQGPADSVIGFARWDRALHIVR